MPTQPLDSAAAARTFEQRSLSGLQQLFARRVVLVTGKGGVGRTTVAAALARLGAEQGRRVLLAEFEEPSSLRTSPLAGQFGEDVFPDVPRLVGENIWGVTLHVVKGTELFLTSLFRVAALARLALRTAPLRRMLHSGPSFHEMGVLYHLLHHLKATRPDKEWVYDLVILDMPATGHTLALTDLPRVLLRLVSRGPIARAMREGQSFMNDPDQAVACVVTLPEPLPVSECLELLEGLAETDVHVGAVLANRLPHNPFTEEEQAALETILEGREVRGQALLDRIRRTDAALARLGKSIGVPLILVGEVDDGPVSEGVVDALRADLRKDAPPGGLPAEPEHPGDVEDATAADPPRPSNVTPLPVRTLEPAEGAHGGVPPRERP